MAYPYQTFAVIIGFIILVIIGIPVYCLYKVIIKEGTERVRKHIHRTLKILGICFLIFFLEELTVSLITEHQVNKQLGFNYATPDTPEGEIFEITRVDIGKTMYKSGLRIYDRVQMNSTFDLYKLLIENQGKDVNFLILREDKKIMIYVKVPEMILPLRKYSINY